jgi:hypothetical protein
VVPVSVEIHEVLEWVARDRVFLVVPEDVEGGVKVEAFVMVPTVRLETTQEVLQDDDSYNEVDREGGDKEDGRDLDRILVEVWGVEGTEA